MDAAAFASTQGVALIASSLASTIAGAQPSAAGASVQVTRITDVATGVVIYSLSGARRLQQPQQQVAAAGSAGVTVAFVVQVPASSPAGAETGVAALLQPVASGGASAGFAAFATQAVVSIAAAASAAGNAALARGIAGAAAAVAAPLPAAPSSTGSGSSGGSSSAVGAGVGAAAAVVAVMLAFVFRVRLRALLCGGADEAGHRTQGPKIIGGARRVGDADAGAEQATFVNPAANAAARLQIRAPNAPSV